MVDSSFMSAKYPDFKKIKSTHQIILIAGCDFEKIENNVQKSGLFLYKMLETIGYYPIFTVNKKPDSDLSKSYRFITILEYIGSPFLLVAVIELIFVLSFFHRRILKNKGAKFFKLNLENSLNNDIEMLLVNNGASKHSSYSGTLLLSPQYHLSHEYTSILYDTYPNIKCVPYLWDSSNIQDLIHTYKWSDNSVYSFTIMESNQSLQKCALVPLMICESYYRSNPDKMDGVVVINGVKLAESNYFLTNVICNLSLYKIQRLFLIKSMAVREIATKFNQNIVICYSVDNDYNYSFLEYLFMGFPVIHNYEMLKDYGYYYNGDDVEAGKQMIAYVIDNHGSRLEMYKASCQQLFWRFSIYNPHNMEGWRDVFKAVK